MIMGNRALEFQRTFLAAPNVNKMGQPTPLQIFYSFSSLPGDTERETDGQPAQ